MAAPAGAAFLGVEQSLSGQVWRQQVADDELVRAHGLRLGLSEPLARALAARGVTSEAAEDYLAPTLKALFPDPSSFLDMDRAAEILVDAVVRDRPAVVFADYAISIARPAPRKWCAGSAPLGRELPIHVPDRMTGLWPSPPPSVVCATRALSS